MATLLEIEQGTHLTQFINTYATCYTLRDIIGYVDGTNPELRWHDKMKVSRELIELITSSEFAYEVTRWREIFTDPWQRLLDSNRLVMATEEYSARSMTELVQILEQTSEILRSLEHRLFKKLYDAYTQSIT